ncbi:MAG: DNA topoisomerase-1 [Planctomycetota bacterium]|jgi:DNA topoisomerase-1
MPKYLVIVESPTKAKTLKKFLGKDYIVESSVGHVRDLPANAQEIPKAMKSEAWSRLGVNVEDDFKPLYVISAGKKKKITELRALIKDVDELLLATDEDREGEAISWHLVEVLKPKVPYKRMVFHEITKPAILEALGETREIDSDLVQAQEARRIIDRLYGYEVSPVLWRKIGPRLSAGRVQSVSIKFLVDRERARMRFRMAEYWDLTANFGAGEKGDFQARLSTIDGRRVAGGKDFDPDTGKLRKDNVHLVDAEAAAKLQEMLSSKKFKILSAEEKPFTRTPAPPFTTSTLQQEGNRKLRFDARRTMRAAQRLYENGCITYMRTDSVILSGTAIDLTRSAIKDTYGAEYLPNEPRTYFSKVKNAQEAHEAIRPAGDEIAPVEEIKSRLGPDEAKIYELIWKRTMACQMKDARGRRMTLKVVNEGGDLEAVFQATGNVIDFPGFLRAYVEGADDPEAALSDRETILPAVEEGESVEGTDLKAEEHRTTPPARLTEATLVKALEESGIGRPSTYASIIDTILRREYSFKKGTAMVPTFTAFAVVALMEVHLTDLIDSSFTAKMEDTLDAISRGEGATLDYLNSFYHGNGNGNIGLRPLLDEKVEAIDPRTVCTIPIGVDEQGRTVQVRVGRYGPFVQREEETAPIPDGTCPDELSVEFISKLIEARARADEPMGKHPESNLPVYLKTGRFGPYVQLGDADPEDKKNKPKMASLLKGMEPEELTFEVALKLLSLPRVVGQDAEGIDINAFNGRYGPYIKRGADTRSLAAEDNLLEVSLERCLALLAEEKRGRGQRAPAKAIKVYENIEELGGVDVKLLPGRYGPYITDGEVNASLPRDFPNPEELTITQVIEMIEQQRERKGSKKKKKKKAVKKKATKKKASKKKKTAKKAAKKASTKKVAAKKTATKKTAAKKKATKSATSE